MEKAEALTLEQLRKRREKDVPAPPCRGPCRPPSGGGCIWICPQRRQRPLSGGGAGPHPGGPVCTEGGESMRETTRKDESKMLPASSNTNMQSGVLQHCQPLSPRPSPFHFLARFRPPTPSHPPSFPPSFPFTPRTRTSAAARCKGISSSMRPFA